MAEFLITMVTIWNLSRSADFFIWPCCEKSIEYEDIHKEELVQRASTLQSDCSLQDVGIPVFCGWFFLIQIYSSTHLESFLLLFLRRTHVI